MEPRNEDRNRTRARRLLVAGVACIAAGVGSWAIGAGPLTHHRSGTNPDGSGWSSKMHERAAGVDLVHVAYVVGLLLVLAGILLLVRLTFVRMSVTPRG